VRLVIVGGSDAGISAALRARQLAPGTDVTVVVADRFPNFSICGIPYHVSGDVPRWQALAHRGLPELEATGMRLRLDTVAESVDAAGRRLLLEDGGEIGYDELVIGTGAVPVRPPIEGLDGLGPDDGVFLLHTMADTFALTAALDRRPRTALIVGAGYVGVEMVEALAARGLAVTQVEALPEVLPTVDPELGRLVRERIEKAGVEVVTGVGVAAVAKAGARLAVTGSGGFRRDVDLVLVVVGVRPDTALARTAGARLGARGAVAVDRSMRTSVPHVWAAGDCAVTHHRLLGETYLPLGTTAHKQGRVAGENAVGGTREYAGSLGSQVVKVFDLVVGRTGLKDEDARADFSPMTVAASADDHKVYYPGAEPIAMRWTGDVHSGRLLGVQMVGRLGSEVAKRVDVAAAAIHSGLTVDAISDLDLTYTPPLGSPWDALQVGAQAWEAAR
jgi:NADPH-dependent 2,4-dienoyl-CoA reductase/sulfur reductase-like enzyme